MSMASCSLTSATRAARRLRSQDGVRSITSLFQALQVDAVSFGSTSSWTGAPFSTSRRILQDEQQSQSTAQAAAAGTSIPSSISSSSSSESSPATSNTVPRRIPDFASMLKAETDTSTFAETTPAASSSTASTSLETGSLDTPNRIKHYGGRQSQTRFSNSARDGQPYKLHAHCTKHNTILSFTKSSLPSAEDLSERQDASTAYNNLANGIGLGNGSLPKYYGQTVLRTSPGMLGLRKAQRGTFEAATRASLQMFTLIRQLGERERTTKHGQKVRDEQAGTIELVLKGFGPGREALISALGSAPGEEIRKKVKRITDATPLKIGGVRPKKRRKLSPPLDLGRRRR